jgi:formate hydrogenlyase transcriptional activator
VRVIAASNRDLEEAVRQSSFRADLLYRLNVFPLRVPPLRERAQDIPLIVGFCLRGLSKKLGKELQGFSRDALANMLRYSWPGNVRELQNIVERAAILARGPILELDAHLAPAPTQPHLAPAAVAQRVSSVPASPHDGGEQTLHGFERSHILEILKKTSGVVDGPRGAARILGLHPNTLRSRMKKLGIERPGREVE